MCSKCPWPMEEDQHNNFCLYIESKKEFNCYPFEKFCETCTTTWLKNGQLCLDHGHEFQSIKSNSKPCLVFFSGHKSCYHGKKEFLIRGDCVETYNGRTICQGFSASPFGKNQDFK